MVGLTLEVSYVSDTAAMPAYMSQRQTLGGAGLHACKLVLVSAVR